MLQPGRKYSSANGYRYGFNGKENDKDGKGDGNSFDFGARIYDPRLGKFMSPDPMTGLNHNESPYNFAGNNPISFVDYEGMFKISPYFVKKYPTLSKILKYYLPRLKKDITKRDKWIAAVGFKDNKAGIAAWEEMLTYGSGPWITPQLSESEIKAGGLLGISIYASRFGQGSGNEWDNDTWANNISVSNTTIDNLETALASGNDEEVAFNALRAMILVMHESGHWARYIKAGLPNRTGGSREDGAIVEEAVFRRRYSYTNRLKDGVNADAIRDDLIRYDAITEVKAIKAITGMSITQMFKKDKTPSGHAGDPLVRDANIKEPIIPAGTNNTGPSNSTNNNYSY